MDILELGCGWGSLSLYMAEHFPKSRITAVSNSTPQRLLIEGRAKERGYVCVGGRVDVGACVLFWGGGGKCGGMRGGWMAGCRRMCMHMSVCA